MIVSYDSAAAADAEAGLRATAAQLRQALDALSSSVAAVCGGWEGDEKVLYQDIQRRWDTAAQEIHEMLTRIGNALDANTQAVQQMRRQVQSVLGG